MPDWGTVLGSGYDAFFDRKDKNREFELRKQQEEALNTLRQIQINKAMKEAELSAEIQNQMQQKPYFQGDQFTTLGQQRYGQLMGGVTEQMGDPQWNPEILKDFGIPQEQVANPEFAPRDQQVRGLMQGVGGETQDISPEQLIKMVMSVDPMKGAELYSNFATKETPTMSLVKTGKYTPLSVMEYIKTKDISKLVPIEKEKIPTTTTLVIGKLRKELGREPTESEILAENDKHTIGLAGAKTTAVETSKQDVQKGLISDDTIKQWAEYLMTKGEMPPEWGRLYRTPVAQIEAQNKITKILNDNGVDGADRVVENAAYQSKLGSLKFQEKQYGAAQSFVVNLKGQIDRVDEIMKDTIKRVGVRAADIPIRDFKTKFMGSGQERVLESYLMEISREIGKLSTGSQASIQELSVEAQKKWDAIHDPNLSLNQLKSILAATKEQGDIRLSSMEKIIQKTKEEFKPANSNRKYYEYPVDKKDAVSAEKEIKEGKSPTLSVLPPAKSAKGREVIGSDKIYRWSDGTKWNIGRRPANWRQ